MIVVRVFLLAILFDKGWPTGIKAGSYRRAALESLQLRRIANPLKTKVGSFLSDESLGVPGALAASEEALAYRLKEGIEDTGPGPKPLLEDNIGLSGGVRSLGEVFDCTTTCSSLGHECNKRCIKSFRKNRNRKIACKSTCHSILSLSSAASQYMSSAASQYI
jgi:hypothetical protein